MDLNRLIFTENACYQAGRKIVPRGIMLHSTGANNPWLRRYVGPDDGRLGENPNANHWNQPYPEGQAVCVHGFIGKLADGSVATYQTLPWDHRGWHAGGSANDSHIGFELCEDGLEDGAYFQRVYREAAELCAELCRMFGLGGKDVICHAEGYQQGIASNHGDVLHWFGRQGKTMAEFRRDVDAILAGEEGWEMSRFTDVAQDKWYAQAVEYVAEQGIMSGKGDGKFDPEGGVTRAELAAVAARLHQMTAGQTAAE